MSKLQVRALLDRPSPRSLGMLGLVVERGDGVLSTEGVLGPNCGVLQQADLADLAAGGHAVTVDAPVVEAVTEGNLAALWVGDEFAAEAEECGLILPPLPKQDRGWNETGTYWIAPTRHVWRVMDSWLVQAFRRVVANKDERLASLMSWALPEREETRAALFFATGNDGERDRNLRWWARLERDHGRPDVTPESLSVRFNQLVEKARATVPKVLGFCGPAKGGDNEVAGWVAKRSNARPVGFGKWLREQILRRGDKPDRRNLQLLGQEMIEKYGGLGFCLEVLGGLSSPLPEEQFVIDGIRHVEVLESIRNLVGAERFVFAFVNRPKQSRRELLIKEGVLPEDVDQVMDDRTEEEIPLLRDRAKFRLNGMAGAEHEGNRLLQAV